MGASRFLRTIIAVSLIFILSKNVASEEPQKITLQKKVVVLSEAARSFGVSVSWKAAEGKLLLTSGQRNAQILIGSERVLVDDHLLLLSAPVGIQDGAVCVPVRDAVAIFSRLLDRQVSDAEFFTEGLASTPLSSAEGSLLIESVRYVSYPRFTRLIITFNGSPSAGALNAQVSEDGRNLLVTIPRSRFWQHQAPVEINDDTVARLEFLQEPQSAKVRVKINADEVTAEVQKYQNPARLVVDVKANGRTAVTSLEPSAIPPPSSGNVEIMQNRPERSPLTTVVLDPGHGGKDVGARGRGGLLEKDVTLDIALRLKQRLEKNSGIKVVLTRNSDSFVSLEERTIIANRAKEGAPADLFISIHTNSHKNASIDGFEVYYISDSVDPGAEDTVALENAAADLEPQGSAVSDSLVPILWDLQFTEFIAESSEFAFIAERRLETGLNTRDRGVRQAKFIVLAGVAMPSVLVETAYISNRVEEAKLKSAEFKDNCAEGLAEAVLNFKERRDARLGLLQRISAP